MQRQSNQSTTRKQWCLGKASSVQSLVTDVKPFSRNLREHGVSGVAIAASILQLSQTHLVPTDPLDAIA